MVVQHVGEREEVMAGVEDHHPIFQVLGGMMIWELAFFGACVHGRR